MKVSVGRKIVDGKNIDVDKKKNRRGRKVMIIGMVGKLVLQTFMLSTYNESDELSDGTVSSQIFRRISEVGLEGR